MSLLKLPLDIIFDNLFDYLRPKDIINIFKSYDFLIRAYPRDRIKKLYIKFFIDSFLFYINTEYSINDIHQPIIMKFSNDIESEFYGYKINYMRDFAKSGGYNFKIIDGVVSVEFDSKHPCDPDFVYGCALCGFKGDTWLKIKNDMDKERRRIYLKYLRIFIEKDSNVMNILFQMSSKCYSMKDFHDEYPIVMTELMLLLI